MRFIQKIIAKYNKKVKNRNDRCDHLIEQIDIALKEINVLFLDFQSFVDPRKEKEWCICNTTLIKNINRKNIKNYKKAKNYKVLLEKQDELYRNANTLKEQISIHNNAVTESKIQNAYSLIGDVEGRKLDKQQMACIVKDFHNHLVIAGAGTGKTTTVVGKIKFLLKSGKCKPEDILVLSFTNASASEMSKRINQETGYNIDASTFHKLGLNIITRIIPSSK